MAKLIVISFLLPIITTQVLAENILFLYPICSPSHKNVAVPVMQGLADRGHNVTVVSSFKTEPHENIRDIIPLKEFHYFPDLNALQLRSEGPMGIILMDYMHFIDYCEQIYTNEDFQQLIDQKWDLIFIDAFTNECLLGFIRKTGAPFIIISPLPVPSHIAVYTGNRLPTSYVPHFMVHFNHEMTLFQRTMNVILTYLGSWGMRRALPYHELTYRKYLGEDMPSGDEILADVSMIFVNSHFAFNFPRPTLPDVVEIGAVHCRPGRPLPKDLDSFLSGAKDGFILFSLGSIVRPHEMPESTRKVFVNVFSRLKQRVLWKWPHEMSDISPNVKLLKWVPQQDVLAHPNIRVFMTHSGLLSTQESIYHGVPMVAIPVFGDQDLNANRATEAGVAVNVEILDITEEKLEAAINEVLREKQFSENVKQMSSFLRDQTETPKERAIFWAEYVMRHQGARHLRSAARELNFFQYYCLDVAAVLFIILVVVTLAVVLTLKGIVKFSWRVLMRSSSGKTKTQ